MGSWWVEGAGGSRTAPTGDDTREGLLRQQDSSLRFAAFRMTNGDVGEGRRGTEDHEGRHNVGEEGRLGVGGGSGRFANRPYRR